MHDPSLHLTSDFFGQLAKASEVGLLTTAMALAVRKDFASLNGLADCLEREGKDIQAFHQNIEMAVRVPQDPTQKEPAATTRTCSFTSVAIEAVRVVDESGHTKNSDTPDDALAFFDRFVNAIHKLSPNPRHVQHHLNSMLHEAARVCRDPKVLLRLQEAGADPNATSPSSLHPLRYGSKEQTLPITEAILTREFGIAATLASITDPDALKYAVELATIDVVNGGKGVKTFAEQAIGSHLVAGLRKHTEATLAFVGSLCSAIEPFSEADHDIPGMAQRFRMSLLGGYLQVMHENNARWDEEIVYGLAGIGDRTQVQEQLTAALQRFVDANGERNEWAREDHNANINQSHQDFAHIESSLFHLVLKTQCEPLYPLFANMARAAASNPTGPGLADVVFGQGQLDLCASLNTHQNPMNEHRLSRTIQFLIDQGHDLNRQPGHKTAEPGNYQLPLHVCACVEDMNLRHKILVTLLNHGVDPTALDAQGRRADELIGHHLEQTDAITSEHHAGWQSICRSFDSKQKASALIASLEAPTSTLTP